ncbi:hypothetical protein [Moorena sp. SIO3H5]|nr:hypothetical protein [Moorena sp. SIO3H5]NEO69696.1 hypothetical protein [Moorena sp. SIO3H5]
MKWKLNLLAKMVVWLVPGILLNFLEVDDLGHYREFIFQRDVVVFRR